MSQKVRVRFIQQDGSEMTVEGDEGDNLMETARNHAVPGIIGECGGNCFCGTCHSHVDHDWFAKLPPRSETEQIVLSGVLHEEANSRLTCQITLKPELDGLVVRVPASHV